MSANDWSKLQLSCVMQAGRANFTFKLNNGWMRNLGKKGVMDFQEFNLQHCWHEEEAKRNIKKIIYQYYTASGPTQLGFLRLLNRDDEVLVEAGEIEEEQDLIEVVLEDNERLIGYQCRISQEDPAELHDIRWMISRIEPELASMVLKKEIGGTAIDDE